MSGRQVPREPGDAELVAASRRGDRDAFARLFIRHRDLLTMVVHRMLDDRALAEDVIQEASVTALTSLDRLRDPARFGPWLAGVGLNLCRRSLRQRAQAARSWEALQGDLAWSRPSRDSIDPGEAAAESELAERVRAAVADLPAGQRRAVVLFYFAGLTQREAAGVLGVEVGAVKARLHQGRAALRARLDSTWRSFIMSEGPADRFVPMRPRNVYRIREAEDSPGGDVVVLQEADGERILPIWIAGSEAVWLAHALEGVETSRPGPYDLMTRLMEESGLVLDELRIIEIVDTVYHAELVLRSGERRIVVDARPSDALNLALRLGARVVASDALLTAMAGRMAREPHEARIKQDRLAGDAAAIVAEAREQQARFMAAMRRWEHIAGVHADAAGRRESDPDPQPPS
jgi:RNA polymerase sigma-70 factor (ECF subfamily)